MKKIELFKEHLREKRALKIISGIDNFDLEKVKKVVLAAEQARSSAIDICANREAYVLARSLTDLPIFVSSINPQELKDAADWGADAIEVGNFDALYKSGVRMGADEVYSLVEQTIELLGGKNIFMSVTIPGHISVEKQIELAKKLEELNIDLIQTEGSATVIPSQTGARGLLETAEVSIANTIELSRNTSIPIMSASGITTTTAAMAFAAGASAVGVGSCVNKLDSVVAMIAVIRTLKESIENFSTSRKVEYV